MVVSSQSQFRVVIVRQDSSESSACSGCWVFCRFRMHRHRQILNQPFDRPPNRMRRHRLRARFAVIALDDLGKPLHALAKDGLSVLLGGNAAEIEDIKSLEDEPLIFSLIVDTSGSTRLSANKQNTTAMQLFRALSTAGTVAT